VRIDLHPEARAEVRSAAVWYEERRPRLGDDFMAGVSDLLERIAEAPTSFPLWPGVPPIRGAQPPIRRAVLPRFPHAIAFEAHPDRVRVLAVAHTKRRPLYWISRAH
jgi:plasmid stabilization system protein ParE